jgi:hypothetical protein
MAKDRVEIPKNLANDVMFASDRTCCVCRTEKLKVQIHHIDENPSNNTFENLAVACLFCHVDAHSTTPFVRNMNPDLLRKYNNNWRAVVKTKMMPDSLHPSRFELIYELFLDVQTAVHYWVLEYVLVKPELHFRASLKDHKQYEHLFAVTSDQVVDSLEAMLWQSADALPYSIRSTLIRSCRRIKGEKDFYQRLGLTPALSDWEEEQDEGEDVSFHEFLSDANRGIREMVADVENQVTALMPPDLTQDTPMHNPS